MRRQRKRLVRNMQARALIWASLAMLLAAVFAVAACNVLLWPRLEQDLRDGQAHVASSMATLLEESNLSLQEILDICVTNSFVVEQVPDFSGFALTLEQAGELGSRGRLYVPGGPYTIGVTLLRAGDRAFTIATSAGGNLYHTTLWRIISTLFLCIFLGMAFMGLSSRRALRPIRALRSALQEVSRGNFNVALPVFGSDEISLLNQNFNQMAQDLSRIEMLRDDFVSNVSHEFKTPLSSIQGYAELLLGSGLPDPQAGYAGVIAEEAGRLSRLTANILRLSKLENQAVTPRRVPFALDEQLRRCLLSFQNDWQSKGLHLDVSLDSVTYEGDEELLAQVWANLMSNAVKFSNEGGTLLLRCYRREAAVQVVVADNGAGMDGETLKRIFEKFYQGDEAHAAQGNGLGLTLAKRIVELCGGSISVLSEVGKGTTFTVELPLERSPGKTKERRARPSAART